MLIPSLEPGAVLPRLIRDLRRALPDAHVVIVDDGSGPTYSPIFREAWHMGATVIGYPENRGKGYALRAGIAWCMDNAPGEIVVCADSDGQHTPEDIALVAEEASAHPDALVLGVRAFTGTVPARSRFGNWMSAQFFRLASGTRVTDTQTGLRAYGPEQLSALLAVPGDRFEWELNALLAAADSGRPIREVPIKTVYVDGNSGSHFRPVADSWRVFRPLLTFMATGLGCWALEMVLFLGLQPHIGIVWSVAVARVASGAANFAANKTRVFREPSRHLMRRQAVEYTLLATFLMGMTMAGVKLLALIGIPLWLAKIAFDLSGFGVSYAVQRRWIFSPKRAEAALHDASYAQGSPDTPSYDNAGSYDNAAIAAS